MFQSFSKIWIVVVVAVFAVAGIFCWQYFDTQKKITEDETANWKTYKNEKYGFEVKYPDDWEKCFLEDEKILLRIIPPILDSDIPEGWDTNYFKSNVCMYGSVEFDTEERKDFNLEKLRKYYSDLYKDNAECDSEILIKEAIFNGYPALDVGSCDLSGMYSGTMTTFFHDQTEFRVHVSNSVIRTVGQEIVDQMFSSFRFLPEETTIEVEIFEEKIAEPKKSAEQIKKQMEKQGVVYTEERQRDARRKADIGQIVMALEIFYSEIGEYAQIGGTATMPSSIGVDGFLISESVMTDISKDPVSGKSYIWVDNTKDSSKFCVYAELEQGGYYAGSYKGTKPLDSPPKNLSCW